MKESIYLFHLLAKHAGKPFYHLYNSVFFTSSPAKRSLGGSLVLREGREGAALWLSSPPTLGCVGAMETDSSPLLGVAS